MIRSSKVSIKFLNKKKLKEIYLFLEEYKRIASLYIDIFWDIEKLPVFTPQNTIDKMKHETWLSNRIINNIGKQTIGVIKNTKRKNDQYLFIKKKFEEENNLKEVIKIENLIEKNKISKPIIKNINPELDKKFIKIDLNNKTSFDGWLTLSSIGKRKKITIPFKRTKHFNNLFNKGILKTSVQLNKKFIVFYFQIEKPKNNYKKTIGIDIGEINTISVSNGFYSFPNKHNYDLLKIIKILIRKKSGSKNFKKCQEHRKNYINWCINQLNLKNINIVKVENIKQLNYKRKTSKLIKHWSYREIFDKLDRYCEEQGVLVQKINPFYTSQRCSKCGWTQKSNRNGKLFKCKKCNFIYDSDLNAAINISLPLINISYQERLKKINKNGFYWSCQERSL